MVLHCLGNSSQDGAPPSCGRVVRKSRSEGCAVGRLSEMAISQETGTASHGQVMQDARNARLLVSHRELLGAHELGDIALMARVT